MRIPELIERVEVIKAAIEWDFPLDFQATLDEVLRVLRAIEADK